MVVYRYSMALLILSAASTAYGMENDKVKPKTKEALWEEADIKWQFEDLTTILCECSNLFISEKVLANKVSKDKDEEEKINSLLSQTRMRQIEVENELRAVLEERKQQKADFLSN